MSVLLGILGVAGVAGNMLAVRYMDRVGAANVVMICLVTMLAAHLLWPWSQARWRWSPWSWPAAGWACSPATARSRRASRSRPAAAPVSIALNSSAIYLGQAFGPAAGGV